MFRREPKETILKKDDELKYIELCPRCDRLEKFTDSWVEKGYSVSHVFCEECLKVEFD